MLCFNHPDRSAVGVCKACGRGLCPDCVTDLGHGLACRGVHEEAVNVLHRLVKGSELSLKRNERWFAAAPRARWIAAGFLAAFGALLFGFGWHDGQVFGQAMGAGFMAFAVILFVHLKRTFGRPDTRN